MPKRSALAAVVALLSLAAGSARADAIDDYVRERMRQLRIPGLALAIVRDGGPATVRTYGLANLELQTPVAADTVFELGSLTKQFTAVAVMMLVEEGKIGLDDSIRKHLPDVPESWGDITVRHLLTHSSGIQEYLSVPGLPDQAHATGHREMTRMFTERLKREFEPGETWAYSNSGYLMLGDIIERVSGKSYWEFLHARIFAPAEMTATRSSDPRAIIRNRAAGYGWRDGAYENRPALTENAYAAGAIASTIEDMVRWEAALQQRKLLSARGYEQIWTPLTVSRGAIPPFSYAVGWVIDHERARKAAFHSGGTPGFSSAIRRYVDDGLAVIVLANHGDRIIDHLPMEIAGMVYPPVARRPAADPDPARSRRLEAALRGLWSGKPDPRAFTPAMQLFLTTATGRGLWEWIASHGELKSLTYVESEQSTLRYKASVGDAELWFSFTMNGANQIAQIYWW